jgi:hypothetical protein
VILAALPIFFAAALAILYCAIQAFRFAGMAMNPRRPVAQRRMRLVFSLLFAMGVVGSAAAGYLGLVALMYYAQK